MFFSNGRIDGTRGGGQDDDGVDLDRDGGGRGAVWVVDRPRGCGGRCGGGGRPGGDRAVYLPGGDDVPLDGGDGDHAALRPGGKAVPAAPAGAGADLSPDGPGPGDHGQHRRQCVRQSAGAWKRGHPAGHRGGQKNGAAEPGDGL